MNPAPNEPGLASRVARVSLVLLAIAFIAVVLLVIAILVFPLSQSGKVKDEAMLAGRLAESFPAADEDYFHDMDGGIPLSADEAKGRNNWIVWTAGNDRFWDLLSVKSVGTLDFIKTLSSRPGLPASRDNRWEYLGLVNEPCYEKATQPDPVYGLWLDKRKPECGPDPFANEVKYPGVKIGARVSQTGSFYGYGTGVIGLRLFPNPDFDAAAKAKWDPVRYYTDPAYYNDRNLVKPYRVGMSCGFCHVGPNPLKPPVDPNNPKFENLSSMVGAQYFWIDRIFGWEHDQSSFAFQLFHTSRPGSLDTSLVSTDNIVNPRTMNAVYGLPARLAMASKWGQEKLADGNLNNKQFNDFVPAGSPLAQYYQAPDHVEAAHILKDGSDSVGALGALNRVFINIGLFSEEWLQHFNALVGGKKVTPIEIAVAEKNSSYWKATENQTPYLAQFILKATGAHHLADAPNGSSYLTKDQEQLKRGKIVFAERCARCHSSKLPDLAFGEGLANCAGKDYLNCFDRYWKLTETDDFKAKMRDIVLKDDFLKDNYLSTDARIPVTLLQTNACSPLATNALEGNIWDNFSSRSYKDLPSVGEITVRDPYTGKPSQYAMPAGGRGYTRVPSLISVWSTAPLLQNNSLGHFEASPSIDARVRSFNDAIEQLLWPEKRAKDADQKQNLPDGVALLDGPGPTLVDRTTQRSYLRVASGYLPAPLSSPTAATIEHALIPWLFGKDGIQIGPIPAGTPVNLLATVDLMSDSTNRLERIEHNTKVVALLLKLKWDLQRLPANPTDEEVRKIFANVEPDLVHFDKCPDFVVNRGHYFGTDLLPGEPGLSDQDKMALIEFLKTF
ncbi:hypothetical protein [Granulicella sibirica]|uniref:Cytochrome c domain-containing protein n=1 Tax=Granulicella sibirica TaxID=2479048 RepID=A0A4V1L508_9BACT|nr:hypothetical protein [Granulicella sibirica]RXH54114.1 hypothetical protein GRAN_4765 [Granulicella sibirica]